MLFLRLQDINSKVVGAFSNRIRVKSASGQVGLGQLGRVNSAGSTRPGIPGLVYIVYEFLFGGSITTLKGCSNIHFFLLLFAGHHYVSPLNKES